MALFIYLFRPEHNSEEAKVEENVKFIKWCISVEVWSKTENKKRTGLVHRLGNGLQPKERLGWEWGGGK